VRIEVALCLPRDAKTVALVRRVTFAALAELGVTVECLEMIRLALSEACSNVIEHSQAEDEYEVRLEVEDELCEITVIDTGGGFDAAALSDSFPPPEAVSGRGVALMHALMDNIAFKSEPTSGTVVHLTKVLDLEPDGALRRLHSGSSSD
jgi:serine/threonine-protein kinase RsbW